jgi:uncharacterized membrane protein
MLLDHFAVACWLFSDLWAFYIQPDGSLAKFLEFAAEIYFSEWKDALRLYVVAAFFVVAGLAVAFSRKNYKSLLKTSLFAGGLTAVTLAIYAITGIDQFLVTHGIFHIFAVCYLFYFLTAAAVKDKYIRSAVLLAAGLFFILLQVYTESGVVVWNDSLLSALFVEKNYFISYMDNELIIPWLGFFLIGAAAAPVLYGNKKSLLPKVNDALNSPVNLFGGNKKNDIAPNPSINFIGGEQTSIPTSTQTSTAERKSILSFKPINILLKIIVKPINFIGRHPLFCYAFSIVGAVLILVVVGLISIGTEWITDILGFF